jgi:hypothetical protein
VGGIELILVVFTFFFSVLEPVDELLHLLHEYRPAPVEKAQHFDQSVSFENGLDELPGRMALLVPLENGFFREDVSLIH